MISNYKLLICSNLWSFKRFRINSLGLIIVSDISFHSNSGLNLSAKVQYYQWRPQGHMCKYNYFQITSKCFEKNISTYNYCMFVWSSVNKTSLLFGDPSIFIARAWQTFEFKIFFQKDWWIVIMTPSKKCWCAVNWIFWNLLCNLESE